MLTSPYTVDELLSAHQQLINDWGPSWRENIAAIQPITNSTSTLARLYCPDYGLALDLTDITLETETSIAVTMHLWRITPQYNALTDSHHQQRSTDPDGFTLAAMAALVDQSVPPVIITRHFPHRNDDQLRYLTPASLAPTTHHAYLLLLNITQDLVGYIPNHLDEQLYTRWEEDHYANRDERAFGLPLRTQLAHDARRRSPSR